MGKAPAPFPTELTTMPRSCLAHFVTLGAQDHNDASGQQGPGREQQTDARPVELLRVGEALALLQARPEGRVNMRQPDLTSLLLLPQTVSFDQKHLEKLYLDISAL